MNAKLTIVTAIAVVSTVVALVEGVLLLQRPTRMPPLVTAQAPAVADSAETSGTAQAPARSDTTPAAEPAAPRKAAPRQEPPVEPAAPEVAADSATGTAAAREPVLTPEEKAAKEKALAKAKLQEALTLQMEQAAKQMIDRLQLNDAQKQLAAPTVDKIRQTMIQMVMAPQKAAEEWELKAQEIRRTGQLTGQTEEQIRDLLKPEQAKLMTQIQDQMAGSMTDVSTTLEELRPILDVQQTQTLDQMKKELEQQQAMMKKMMAAMTKPDAGAGSATPAP